MLTFYLRLGFPSCLFPTGLFATTIWISLLPHISHTPLPYHHPWFDNPIKHWWYRSHETPHYALFSVLLFLPPPLAQIPSLAPVAYRGEVWGGSNPPPRNSEDIGGVLDRMSKNRCLDFLLCSSLLSYGCNLLNKGFF